jgi:hypothetical protein
MRPDSGRHRSVHDNRRNGVIKSKRSEEKQEGLKEKRITAAQQMNPE